MLDALIIDCEVQKCIPPSYFKVDPYSELPIEDQFYKNRMDYIGYKSFEWTEEYTQAKLDDLHDEMVNPVTGSLYKYCGGWEDYENMGISCIGVRDCVEKQSLIFRGSDLELESFQRLVKKEK